MKRNFLLMLLLTILPFTAWAANYTVRTSMSPTAAGTFNGGDQALPTISVTYNAGSSYYPNWTAVPNSAYTVTWKYNGSTVTVAHNAGTYTATIAATSGNSVSAASGYSLTFNWTMNRANNTVTAPEFAGGDSWEYGQTAHAATATTLDGTPTFQWSTTGTGGWQDYPSAFPTDQIPNTYYVRASVAQTLNYNAATSGNATITVQPAVITVTPGVETAEWRDPFKGRAMSAINPTVTGAVTDWSLIQSYMQWKQLDEVVNVGNGYAYTLERNTTDIPGNIYNIVVNGNGTVNVEKSTAASLAGGAPAGPNLTYSGENQSLALAPADVYQYLDGYTMKPAGDVEYRIIDPATAATEWSTSVPVAKDADTYTIACRGKGDQNHTDYENPGDEYTVTILPYEIVAGKDFTAPTAVVGTVYDGAPHAIANAGEFIGKFKDELATAGAKFQYDGFDDLPKEQDFGTYSFVWNISIPTGTNFKYTKADETVNGATIVKATIVAADVTDPIGATGLEYKLDKSQQLLASGAVVANDPGLGTPKGVAWYSVDGGAWTNVLANVVGEHVKANGEKYVVSWYIAGNTNYEDYGSTTEPAGTVEVAIAPVQFTLKADAVGATGLVFNNADQKLLTNSVTGGAANMPQGSTTWSLNGTALAAGSTYEDLKGKDAGTYHISYTVVPKDAKYENDYLPYTKEDIPVFIGQYTLYIGAKTLKGTIEEFVDLETMTPLFKMSDFLKDGAFIGGETPEEKEAILNQLIAPKQTPAEIIAASKAGSATTVDLQIVDVDPDVTPMNYKVDAATLLSDNASLDIVAIEAAIQTDPVGATLTYNGDDQELIETAAVGYKAMGGASTSPNAKAIGKVVYSLTEKGEYTDDLTKIVGKDAKDDANPYTVYYKVELSKEATSLDRFYKYETPVKSIDVTIAKKALDLAMFEFDPATKKAEFNGNNQLPVITPKATEPITADDWYFEFADGKGNPIANPNEGVKNVDVYAVTLKAEADGNYTGDVSTTWEITPKPIDADDVEFVLATSEVEYDGADHVADVEVVPTAPLTDADYDVVTPAEMINQGKYTITLNAKGNYSGSTTATFTITKKPLTADMFVITPDKDVIFDGTDQYPEVKTLLGAPITTADYNVKVTVEGNDKLFTELIDADTYTFTFTATADGNYSGSATKEWTIAQATAKIVEPTKVNLTYNGKNQALVTEGTTDAVAGSEAEPAGKVEYQVTSAFENKVIVKWTDDYSKVVALNADQYTIDYRITASEKNYTNPLVEGSISNEILKAKVAYMLSNLEKTWDGETFTDEEVATVFTLYTGELFGDDAYDVPFTLTLPEDYKDAGTYSFKQAKYEFKEGKRENYKVNFTGEANIIINKADIVAEDFEAPEPMVGMIYNGEDKELVSKGEVTTKYEDEPIGVILFSTTENGEYSTSVPTGKDAGAYEVWYIVKGDKNHNDTKAVKLEAGIMPKKWDAVLAFEDAIGEDALTYNTKDQMPDTELKDGETVLEKGKDYTLVIEYTPANETGPLAGFEPKELINAGKYDFTYTGINNYEGAEVKRTIVINPADLADVAVVTINGELIKDYESASVKYTSKDQKPNLGLRYEGAILAAETDYEVAAEDEMINAGEYEFSFTAVAGGNYKGETTATFTVTPLEVIVEAANATKVYDGEEGFDELPELTFNGVLENEIALVDEIFDFDATAFTFAKAAKNVGTYAFEVVPEEITATNYEVTGANGADFTITPAPLVVEWNDEAEPFTKVYGEADPALTATADNVDVTGAVNAEEEAAIITLTKITRAEGEAVGKYAVTLSAKPAVNSVFANYEVEKAFPNNKGKEAFVITEATVKVSIAALEKVYDGEAATIEVAAEDLVVTGLKNGDKKEDIFSELPTATVADGKAVNVGTYQVTLAGGKAADYVIELIPSTFDIVPATITTATIASQQIKKGQDVEENIDATAFTIEGVIAADADKFYVTVNDKYQDFDGKVSADKGIYNDGLVIAVDDEAADNYTGYEKFFGELRVLPAEAMVIADNEDWTTEAKHAEAVTFTDRAINAGNWNVVALPFATTVKQVSDAFGYAAVDVLNETASDGSIHFQVISSGVIPAYTPFIVKTTEDEDLLKDNFNQVVFEDVDLEPWTKAENSEIKDAANNKFIGTFKALTEIPAGSKAHWYMSKGTWYDTANRTKAVNLKAFRAYVEFDPANVAAGARIYIEEPDGTETSIDAVEFNQMVNGDNTYTVDGKKVSNTAQKGVYIQNGKKVAVK